MPGATMFTVIRTMSRYGKTRANYVSLPLTPLLLDEPGFTAGGRKYLALSDEPEPPVASDPLPPKPGRIRREPLPTTTSDLPVPDEFRTLKMTRRLWPQMRKQLRAAARKIRRQHRGVPME